MKILTINLKAGDGTDTLKKRLKPLIKFIEVNDTDVILVQEAPAGIVSWYKGNCLNAVNYIASKVNYYSSSIRMTGWPGIYNIRLGVISKLPIDATYSEKTLDMPMINFTDFKWDADHLFPWSRKMLGVDINGIAFFCAHLGYDLGYNGFLQQAEKSIPFFHKVMSETKCNKAVLAGDMNYNHDVDNPNPFYSAVISDLFLDVQYGKSDVVTFGMHNNPYGSAARPSYRIDYIFVKNMKVVSTNVVFNKPGMFISDHAGVYAEIE